MGSAASTSDDLSVVANMSALEGDNDITVKLDKKRAARLTPRGPRRKGSKFDAIRASIDRAGPIETGQDLMEWVEASKGRGLGLAQMNDTPPTTRFSS
jgi:hypothetical protein